MIFQTFEDTSLKYLLKIDLDFDTKKLRNSFLSGAISILSSYYLFEEQGNYAPLILKPHQK